MQMFREAAPVGTFLQLQYLDKDGKWAATERYMHRRTPPTAICRRNTVRRMVHLVLIGLFMALAGVGFAAMFIAAIIEWCKG